MSRLVQHVMHCPCGNAKVLALGLCATCYTLKRQDEEHFGGLREAVLERDGYRCRVCDASGRDKRSIIVHHRVPGKSVLSLMLSLCPGCHAKVHRTKAVLSAMPPLLLELWREQHPKGHEQVQLDFKLKEPALKLGLLLPEADRNQRLMVRRKRRKRLVRERAVEAWLTGANQEWAIDFIVDGLTPGRMGTHPERGGCLNARVPALESDTSLESARVARVLTRLIEERGWLEKVGRTTNRSSLPGA